MDELSLSLPLIVFAIAMLYGSVGHGGASGYLAVLSLLGVPHMTASTTALVLNLFVAGIAFASYRRAGHFSARLLAPLLFASVPFAFLGGLLRVTEPVYYLLLTAALVAAAFRMLAVPRLQTDTDPLKTPTLPANLAIGAVLGLVSGMVGVGGGIFLSPLMILLRWADAKVTSATAAGFILANSLAGLGGRLLQGGDMLESAWTLVLAGVLGGWMGSTYGAWIAPKKAIRQLLALVLLIAACKMILKLL